MPGFSVLVGCLPSRQRREHFGLMKLSSVQAPLYGYEAERQHSLAI